MKEYLESSPIYTEGQTVRIDEGYANTGLVTVVSQTPLRLHTIVKDGDSEWTTMTDRLSLNDLDIDNQNDNVYP